MSSSHAELQDSGKGSEEAPNDSAPDEPKQSTRLEVTNTCDSQGDKGNIPSVQQSEAISPSAVQDETAHQRSAEGLPIEHEDNQDKPGDDRDIHVPEEHTSVAAFPEEETKHKSSSPHVTTEEPDPNKVKSLIETQQGLSDVIEQETVTISHKEIVGDSQPVNEDTYLDIKDPKINSPHRDETSDVEFTSREIKKNRDEPSQQDTSLANRETKQVREKETFDTPKQIFRKDLEDNNDIHVSGEHTSAAILPEEETKHKSSSYRVTTEVSDPNDEVKNFTEHQQDLSDVIDQGTATVSHTGNVGDSHPVNKDTDQDINSPHRDETSDVEFTPREENAIETKVPLEGVDTHPMIKNNSVEPSQQDVSLPRRETEQVLNEETFGTPKQIFSRDLVRHTEDKNIDLLQKENGEPEYLGAGSKTLEFVTPGSEGTLMTYPRDTITKSKMNQEPTRWPQDSTLQGEVLGYVKNIIDSVIVRESIGIDMQDIATYVKSVCQSAKELLQDEISNGRLARATFKRAYESRSKSFTPPDRSLPQSPTSISYTASKDTPFGELDSNLPSETKPDRDILNNEQRSQQSYVEKKKKKKIKKMKRSDPTSTDTSMPMLQLYRPGNFEPNYTRKTYVPLPPIAHLPHYPKLAFPRRWGAPLLHAEPRSVLVGFTCPPVHRFRQDQLMTHSASTLKRYYNKPCIKALEWIKVTGRRP